MTLASAVSNFGRVGLLYGGNSAEREISLMSGEAVHKAMLDLGIDVVAIDAGEDLLQVLPSHNLDLVFIALHGPGGEDGTLQGALEYLGIPYTGQRRAGLSSGYGQAALQADVAGHRSAHSRFCGSRRTVRLVGNNSASGWQSYGQACLRGL